MSRHVPNQKQGMTFLKFSSFYGLFCEYEYMNIFGNNQKKTILAQSAALLRLQLAWRELLWVGSDVILYHFLDLTPFFRL